MVSIKRSPVIMRNSFRTPNQPWADAHQAAKDTVRPQNRPLKTSWASHLMSWIRLRKRPRLRKAQERVPPKAVEKASSAIMYLLKTPKNPRQRAYTQELILSKLTHTLITLTQTCSIESNLRIQYIIRSLKSTKSPYSPCVNNVTSLLRCKISITGFWTARARR